MHRVVAVVVSLVVGVALLAAPAEAGSPPVSLPSSPRGLKAPVTLPAGVDPPSPYLPQVSCSPAAMPGTTKLRDLVLATYRQGGSGPLFRGCTEGVSEHSEGRAWDWMVNVKNPSQKAAAADFLAWVTRDGGRNARRLGIMYVIYNEKIWSVYRASEGWRASAGHKDHVHVSLSWSGARGNVSFWTGRVGATDLGPCVRFSSTYGALTSTPRAGACPAMSGLLKKTSLATRQYGTTGATVEKAQGLLKVRKTRVFDVATWAAVKHYQRIHDLPYTGVLDQPTWASLSPANVTSKVVSGYTRAEAVEYGVGHYSRSSIKRRDVGKAVMFLQTALHLPVADRNGYFDAVTLAAVKRVQEAAGLSTDGVVSGEEWKAMQDALG